MDNNTIIEYLSCEELDYFDNASNTTFVDQEAPMKWSSILTMIVCVFGLAGNLCNLVVLSIKQHICKLQSLEVNANITLMALAISDMCFCILVFPHPLTDGHGYNYKQDELFVLYYRYYGHGLVNTFIMISTYMVVILATERYIVMYYPLRAKIVLHKGTTIAAIVILFVFCVMASLPYYFNQVVTNCFSSQGELLFELLHRWQHGSVKEKMLQIYITWIWPLLATFLPLTLLLYCNIKIIIGLKNMQTMRMNSCPRQTVKPMNHRTTVILIVIIFAAIFLLTPAEVVKVINPYDTWGEAAYVVQDVVNFMQSLNFCFNFMLYCMCDKNFCKILCGRQSCCGPHVSENRCTGTTYQKERIPLHRRANTQRSQIAITRSTSRENPAM